MWKFTVICIVLGIMRHTALAAPAQASASSTASAGAGGSSSASANAVAMASGGGFQFPANNYYHSYNPYYDPYYGSNFGYNDPWAYQTGYPQQQQQNRAYLDYIRAYQAYANANGFYDTTGLYPPAFGAPGVPGAPGIGIRLGGDDVPSASTAADGKPNVAVASGSIGPGGYTQTAYISPSNPAVPNIVNRFGGDDTPASPAASTFSGPANGAGGFKSVSVSSHSSSNPDGSSVRRAQTTVNDNGKVTSYTVNS